MGELLRLDGVCKSFGGVAAVRDFSLSVSEGENVGVIGPNGAGKSTLFGVISGGVKADSGTVVFGGVRADGLGPHRLASLGVSRTFQIARPFPRMTAAENVAAGAVFGKGTSMGAAMGEARELLGLVSLSGKEGVPAGSLTLAEQRRLELARALATGPKLLMVDEVMAGLTPVERGAMADLLGRTAAGRGITMLVSEHVMDSVARLCRRLVVMDRGAKVADGETDAVLRSEQVAEVYLGKPRRGASG